MFNIEEFLKIKEDVKSTKDVDGLVKDFLIKLSKDYRRDNTEFDPPAKPTHTEYVFPFASYIDGIYYKKFYRFSVASDGLSVRLKSAFKQVPLFEGDDSKKSTKSIANCEKYIAEHGVELETDASTLIMQNGGGAVFLKQMFSVRLFSDWLKTQPEHLKSLGLSIDKHNDIVDINKKNADMYLLGIIFYQQETVITKDKKTADDYLNWLFLGEKDNKKRFEGFENISPDVVERMNNENFHQLIDVLQSHPLLSYYLKWEENESKMNDKRKDLLDFLHQCLRYQEESNAQSDDGKGFYLVPVIDEVILNKRQRISDLLVNEDFSSLTYYKFLGKIAEKASHQPNKHAVPIKYVYDLFKDEKEFKEFKENQYDKKLHSFAIKGNKNPRSGKSTSDIEYGQYLKEFPWFGEFITIEDGMFRFKDKISRLYFTANNLCIDYNEFWLFERMLACCEPNEETEDNVVKVSSRFDSLILLSTMTMHLMPWRDSQKFLRYLATEQASLYEAKNRYKQIAAIAIISYSGLLETHLISNSFRAMLLRVAYGYKRYEFQYDQISALLKQPFYKKTIKDHFEKIRNKPGDEQPLYFFLYHYKELVADFAPDKKSNNTNLYKCFMYRDKAWRNDFSSTNEMREFEDFIHNSITEFGKFLYSKANVRLNSDYKTIIQIYAIQSFLFAVSHYSQTYSIEFLNQNERSQLIKVAIYCDYYTRKFNRLYNKIYTGGVVTQEEQKKLFLLCGPCRVSCIGEYKIGNKIHLSGNMLNDYKLWLDNEKGRYKILLMRLLAYTDFYDNNTYTGKDVPSINGNDFLQYDNIDIEKLYQSKHARDKKIDPFSWYKTL